jgi:DNA-binding winged helix-turn-helix (wHTH) protein
MKGIRQTGISIGPLNVDLARREIHINGESARIGDLAFDILEILVWAGGQVVSRKEIIDHVWPDTVVSHNNLQVQMCALRKALGESRWLIKTIHGKGYKLVSTRQGSVTCNCGHNMISGLKTMTRVDTDWTHRQTLGAGYK